jgi:hypothetical protein
LQEENEVMGIKRAKHYTQLLVQLLQHMALLQPKKA